MVSTEDLLATLMLRWLDRFDRDFDLQASISDDAWDASEKALDAVAGAVDSDEELLLAIAAVEARYEVERAREKVLAAVGLVVKGWCSPERLPDFGVAGLVLDYRAYQAALARSSL